MKYKNFTEKEKKEFYEKLKNEKQIIEYLMERGTNIDEHFKHRLITVELALEYIKNDF